MDKQDTAVEELKSRVRSAMKIWHPDKVGHPKNAAQGEQEVIHVLTALVGKDANTEAWPAGTFETGTKVVFPPAENETENKVIFLPATPEGFLNVLEYVSKNNGRLPEKDFPLVELKIQSSQEKTEERNKIDEDPTLLKFQKFVMDADTIERLERAFDLFSLYSEEQLRSVAIPEIIDRRAQFIFTRDAWAASKMDEIDLIKDQISRWGFFNENVRSSALLSIEGRLREKPVNVDNVLEVESANPAKIEDNIESERRARKEFVQRVRDAQTPELLDVVVHDVNNFNFFNRGELGVVKSVISRKMQKFGRVWEG